MPISPKPAPSTRAPSNRGQQLRAASIDRYEEFIVSNLRERGIEIRREGRALRLTGHDVDLLEPDLHGIQVTALTPWLEQLRPHHAPQSH